MRPLRWPSLPVTALVAVLVAVLAAGCTSLGTLPEDPRHELAAVPFFPQTLHQCGPAALATVLGASGVDIDPETLTPEVYLPDRHGSLQVELLAAARRHGRLAFVVEPRFETLLAEVEAGHPVLLLQDLGALGIRWWHYAVVIGFDAAGERVVLRSGAERRRVVSRQRFLRSWQSGGNWGVVITTPSQPPATATGPDYVKAVVEAGPWLTAADTDTAYRVMRTRWPGSPLVLLAAGNRAYAQGKLTEAIGDYRALLALEPRHVAGLNNLANALLDAGCPATALAEATKAADLVDPDSPLAAAVVDTHAKAVIAARRASDALVDGAPARASGESGSVCAAE